MRLFIYLIISLFLTCQKSPVKVQKDPFVEQAHSELWKNHIDKNGLILDYVGEIPTPEDCAQGRPNAIGWLSPLANGTMFTGLYLPAACERARQTGSEADKANARILAKGLMKSASVSDVPGMIVRGFATDGKSHYAVGSDDQTHPWFYGLHAYVKSDIPSTDERKQIVSKMTEVAEILESTGWKCPCDGAFKGQFRGGFTGHLFRDAARYLHMLRIMYDITGDNIWLDRYKNACSDRPENSEKTRAEICAMGYAYDREAIKNIDDGQLWIYVGSQAALANLILMETDKDLISQYKKGLEINVANSLKSVAVYSQFNNNSTERFGQSEWRKVYTKWVPQPTQADAEMLAQPQYSVDAGKQKGFEVKYMKNPLAAATIISLGGGDIGRNEVENAIHHYDYSIINMSEFFLAECAYYSLPVK